MRLFLDLELDQIAPLTSESKVDCGIRSILSNRRPVGTQGKGQYAICAVSRSCASFIGSWIFDSGASDDMLPRILCPPWALEQSRKLTNGITVMTAGGKSKASHTVRCEVSALQGSVNALILGLPSSHEYG